jgi:mono/diheme cytochrome c family protein
LLRDGDVESDLLPQSASPEQVELGRRYFHELQCANCHERDSATPNQLAKPLAEVNLQAKRSCLQNPTDAMPKYSLDDRQRAAIRASLAAPLAQDPSTVGDAKARELVQHRMLQLNCFGCHERTDESGQVLGGIGRFRKAYFQTVHQLDLGDEGRLPPPLTGVGRKFLPAALQSIFTEGSTARRPSMTIRMPSYPKEAIADIVQWLPKADQADVAAEARVFSVAQETAQIGRELVNTGCVECHPFRGESLPGAVGIDLHGIHLQVQPAWFLEFVRDPGTVKPRTRMPTFFPDGRSHRPDLLDGDVAAQVGAIWHYLKTCDPLPAKIIEANSRNFELVPADRPLLLRTFLRDAGNHAIAVGLPGRLNFAWDAERVRLATAWKGRFLDARSTWFERFAPPAEPLAEKVIQFPVDPCFQLADQAVAFDGSSSSTKGVRPAISFDGFRLDRDGYPTFLYHVGSWNVEDRLEADPSLALRRILVVRQSDRENSGQTERDLHWIAHAGKELQRVSATSVVDEQGMSVTLLEGIDVEGELSDTNVGRRWVFPLPEGREHRIIVEYQW